METFKAFSKGQWITDKDFVELEPLIDLLDENKRQSTSDYNYSAIKKRFPHKESLKNRHMLIRKELVLDVQPKNAYIDITADDYYKLYINGKYVGQGPAPAYYFRYNVNRYDISAFLKEGKNVIAVHVYYQGAYNIVWPSYDYRMGMIAELYCDGELKCYTDKSWKYALAQEYIGKKISVYYTAYSEDIDGRKKLTGWKQSGYSDEKWQNVCVKENYDYSFYQQITPSLQIYTLPPKEIREVKKGNYILDFGGELTGRILLSAKGKRGDVIKISYGEEMESADKVRGEMRCDCHYNEKWILSGDNDELETYDYKGFRYVQIISKRAKPDLTSVKAEVRHYPFDEGKSAFKSSNALLNDVWKICQSGVKYCTQEGYLDCPTREKGQFLGDALITARSHAYLTGDYRIYKKFLTDCVASSKIISVMPNFASAGKTCTMADYSLQWPLHLLSYYELSGDLEFLRQTLSVTEGVIEYFEKFCRADGLLDNIKDITVLIDWPIELRDNYDHELSAQNGEKGNTLINAFYIGALEAVNKIKNLLGISVDGKKIEKAKASFVKAYYDTEKKIFVDREGSSHSSLHANALSLYFGLAPESENIVALIKKKRLSCGVYVSYFVLKALARVGEYDFIYELLTAEDKNSWGNMLKEGATTCFEVWSKEQKINISLCHSWASSPIIVLIEDILGIKIEEAGFKKLNLNPHIPASLKNIAIRFPSPVGEIRVEYENEQIKTNIKTKGDNNEKTI